MSQAWEGAFAPAACEYWQANRIPHSLLYPRARFLRWLSADSEDNYYRRGNRAFTIESVGYEFNSLGYRGPELERRTGEAGAMFIGDSNTLGLGMPWEHLWTSLVRDRLEQRWGVPVRQFNLGWPATGSDYVAMMVHQCVDVLEPDAVCVLWSYVPRMTWFAGPRRQIHFQAEYVQKVDPAEHAAYLRLATEANSFFNFIRNFHLVHAHLTLRRIPFYWGSIEPLSLALLRSYVPLDGYVGAFPSLDLARDGRHAGVRSHARFAARVLEVVDREGVLRTPRARPPTPVAPPLLLQPPRWRIAEALPEMLREMATDIRLRWRVRTMKRRDPFIY
jgi:hypothetical protein